MEHLIFMGTAFLIILIIFIIKYLIQKKKGTVLDSRELELLKKWFSLTNKDFKNDKIIFLLAIINSFIMSFTATIVNFLKVNYIWKILIALLILMILIYIFYEIIGRILYKKEGKKNEHKRNWKKMATKMGRRKNI